MPIVELSLMKSGWKISMHARSANILLSAQEWCRAATNGDGEKTFQEIAQEPTCY